MNKDRLVTVAGIVVSAICAWAISLLEPLNDDVTEDEQARQAW